MRTRELTSFLARHGRSEVDAVALSAFMLDRNGTLDHLTGHAFDVEAVTALDRLDACRERFAAADRGEA